MEHSGNCSADAKSRGYPRTCRNFLKGELPIKVAVKSHENPVRYRADDKSLK